MSSDLETFNKLVDNIWELVFGTERRPKEKPKRARTKKGKYKADDPKTKGYNEAYVGGKAPKDLLGIKKSEVKMSQGDLDGKSPWAWSDKTIVGLMNELKEVRDLIEKYPNNMELGKKIREWYFKKKEE